MKRIIIILFLVIFFVAGKSIFSQNLVPNSSFESVYNCDSCQGFIVNLPGISQCAIGWDEILPTRARYFNPCIITPDTFMYSVPRNFIGTQYAHTGQAYGEIAISIFLSNIRDYICIQLNQPLSAGKRYYAGFYVSLADSSNIAIDAIGACFTVGKIDTSGRMLNGILNITDLVPQVSNQWGNVLRDTQNWVLIGGSFTARGGEDYITIGCFVKDEDVITDSVGDYSGYRTAGYYLDDVYVGDSATTGISLLPEENRVSIYPNPVQDELTVNFFTAVKAKTYILLTDVLGNTIIRRDLNPLGNTATIDVGNLKQGVYFVRVFSGNGVIMSRKIVKSE